MAISHFIYSLVDGHLGCFLFPAIMNNAAMNIHVWVLCGHVSISLGYMPKRENGGSCYHSFLLILYIKVMSRTQIQCYFHSVPPMPT